MYTLSEELVEYIVHNYASLQNREKRRDSLENYKNWVVEHRGDLLNGALMKTAFAYNLSEEETARLASVHSSDWNKAIAEMIYQREGDKLFINICPICGTIARTPFANQCRKGHRFITSSPQK